MRDWYEASEWREVGRLVLSTGGQWMVRPPQQCRNGHPLTPGRVLVGTMACSCGERRHLTWLCDCGDMTYGPALGVSCSILNGPALIR
jgi:hypothetical protein